MKTDVAIAYLVAQYGALPNHLLDVELLLHHLREHGCSKIDSMRALIQAYHIPLKEAKQLVHLSQTWADVRAQDDTFHDRLLKTVEQFITDQSEELSR